MKEFSKYSISLPLAQNGMLSTSQFFFFETSVGFEEMQLSVCKLPWWLTDKESTCKAEDAGNSSSIPGLGRSPRGYPLQYSCLENHVDRRAWWATVHGVTKSRMQLKPLSTHTHTADCVQASRGLGGTKNCSTHLHLPHLHLCPLVLPPGVLGTSLSRAFLGASHRQPFPWIHNFQVFPLCLAPFLH